MSKHSMICAGIDTAKHKLDVAIDGSAEGLQVDNTPGGHRTLSAWLRKHRAKRVGIEASGGYEKAVIAHLRQDGFLVVLFQPAQVRAYARFRLQRAKNDRIDALLIAACTAAVETIHAPPDPRLAPLAEQLTMIEQIEEDLARFKTRRESSREQPIRRFWDEEIARIAKQLKRALQQLLTAIRQHPDLAERFDLIASVDGVGPRTALAILIRMPEIGRITREQAAALAGLAPYDDDSGEQTGARHIQGGRKRLRKSLYSAALAAAFRWNDQLIQTYKRLITAGKSHKVALVACARKLLIFVNTIVARGKPWIKSPSNA